MWTTTFCAFTIVGAGLAAGPQKTDTASLAALSQQLAREPAKALPVARARFEQWAADEPTCAALVSFQRRLKALGSLHEQITRQLEDAGQQAVDTLVLDIVDGKSSKAKKAGEIKLVPAEELYRLYLPYFQVRIETAGLSDEQRSFLMAYYHAEVKSAIDGIMRRGRPLSAASDRARDVEYYLLLLPLLHSLTDFDASLLNELPDWVVTPDHLERLSDFCLFQLARLDAAAKIAFRKQRQQASREAYLTFFREAAEKCLKKDRPARTVQCLNRVRELLDAHDPRRLDLRFRICSIWENARNYALAASEAGTIARDRAGTDEAGKALWIRLRCLDKQEDSQTVLCEVDDAMAQPVCASYLADLLCFKWRALRKAGQGQQASDVLRAYLARFPESPHVAEMYFIVAADCLSAQRYEEARNILQSLVKKFPKSTYAHRAQGMMKRLDKVLDAQGQ